MINKYSLHLKFFYGNNPNHNPTVIINTFKYMAYFVFVLTVCLSSSVMFKMPTHRCNNGLFPEGLSQKLSLQMCH